MVSPLLRSVVVALFLLASCTSLPPSGAVPLVESDALELVDVTYDGQADLKILVARGSYNRVYQYWAWNPEPGIYEPLAGLEAVSNPEFDPRGKTLVSFHKGRAIGDLWVQREFSWREQRWQPTVETERRLLDENVEGSGYVVIRRVYQDQIWIETARDDEFTSPP